MTSSSLQFFQKTRPAQLPAGWLIGKGGRTSREMQENSGAFLHVIREVPSLLTCEDCRSLTQRFDNTMSLGILMVIAVCICIENGLLAEGARRTQQGCTRRFRGSCAIHSFDFMRVLSRPQRPESAAGGYRIL